MKPTGITPMLKLVLTKLTELVAFKVRCRVSNFLLKHPNSTIQPNDRRTLSIESYNQQ